MGSPDKTMSGQLLVRVFGSYDCAKCLAVKKAVEEKSLPFVFVDANADETQDECDRHNVDKLPHVQLVDQDGQVIGSWIGDTAVPEKIVNEYRIRNG